MQTNLTPQKTVYILVGTNEKLNKIYLERISAGKSVHQFKLSDLDKDLNLVVSNTSANVFFSNGINDIFPFEKLIFENSFKNSIDRDYRNIHFFSKAPDGKVKEIADPVLVISCNSLSEVDKEYFEKMEHVAILNLNS